MLYLLYNWFLLKNSLLKLSLLLARGNAYLFIYYFWFLNSYSTIMFIIIECLIFQRTIRRRWIVVPLHFNTAFLGFLCSLLFFAVILHCIHSISSMSRTLSFTFTRFSFEESLILGFANYYLPYHQSNAGH